MRDFIEKVIKERLSDVKIHKLLDGAVLFETETSYDKLNFFCFNNIFAVINLKEEFRTEAQDVIAAKYKNGGNGKQSVSVLESFINSILIKEIDSRGVIANNSRNFNTFRIVISNENVPAAIDEKLRLQAENFISRLSGLKVNRSLPDTEFWFLYRRDDISRINFSVFMKRLTLRSSWDKTLHKGELPPPVAWVLCRLANLVHSDVVLDPFCGYGSIPEAAFKYFHITKFIACDNNSEAAGYSAARFKKRKKSEFNFFTTDFSELPSLLGEVNLTGNLLTSPPESGQSRKQPGIDAIVTDPPWGHFEKSGDDGFLVKMFEVFSKLLKDGGRAAVLYANDENFTKAIPSSFELQTQIPILLSGKKAVIYTLRKISSCLCASV